MTTAGVSVTAGSCADERMHTSGNTQNNKIHREQRIGAACIPLRIRGVAHYSSRSVRAGSIRATRNAGAVAASNDTAASISTTEIAVFAS